MSEVEWSEATLPWHLMEGDEKAVDGNTPSDTPGDGFIGVGIGACIIYGTPLQILKSLAGAMTSVTEHIQRQAGSSN